jgi:hypothetical protein
MSKKAEKVKLIRQLRDEKVRAHLEQYAPVWLVKEEPVPDDEAIFFTVVFLHPQYGWVDRRYRFDAFSNVLYYFGERLLSEEDALKIEEEKPYIPAEVINTVNSYGG